VTAQENINQTLTDPKQHSLAKSIILHLLPGLLILLFYIVTAPIANKMGFPSIIALLIAIGVVLIPFELGFLLYQGKKENGTLSLKGIVLLREPMPWWRNCTSAAICCRGSRG
jgi:hypothetical protein